MTKTFLRNLASWFEKFIFPEDAQDWARLEFGRSLQQSDLDGRLK